MTPTTTTVIRACPRLIDYWTITATPAGRYLITARQPNGELLNLHTIRGQQRDFGNIAAALGVILSIPTARTRPVRLELDQHPDVRRDAPIAIRVAPTTTEDRPHAA